MQRQSRTHFFSGSESFVENLWYRENFVYQTARHVSWSSTHEVRGLGSHKKRGQNTLWFGWPQHETRPVPLFISDLGISIESSPKQQINSTKSQHVWHPVMKVFLRSFCERTISRKSCSRIHMYCHCWRTLSALRVEHTLSCLVQSRSCMKSRRGESLFVVLVWGELLVRRHLTQCIPQTHNGGAQRWGLCEIILIGDSKALGNCGHIALRNPDISQNVFLRCLFPHTALWPSFYWTSRINYLRTVLFLTRKVQFSYESEGNCLKINGQDTWLPFITIASVAHLRRGWQKQGKLKKSFASSCVEVFLK